MYIHFFFMYQTCTCVHHLQSHSHINFNTWSEIVTIFNSYYFNMIFSKRISGEWSICLVFVTLETHALWMQSYSLWGKLCWHCVPEWSNMYPIENMLSLKKYKPWIMRLQGFSSAKLTQNSLNKSLHYHKLLVWIQILAIEYFV